MIPDIISYPHVGLVDPGMSRDIRIRCRYQNRSLQMMSLQPYPIDSCKSQVSVTHEARTEHAAF